MNTKNGIRMQCLKSLKRTLTVHNDSIKSSKINFSKDLLIFIFHKISSLLPWSGHLTKILSNQKSDT